MMNRPIETTADLAEFQDDETDVIERSIVAVDVALARASADPASRSV